MKTLNLSLVAILAMSTFAMAGGDIEPVEPVVEAPYVEESTGGLYLGLAYSLLKSDSDFFDANVGGGNLNLSFDDDYSAIMIQAGYKFNDYVALEGRYWAGLTDNSYTTFGNTFDSDASAWGVYVKPMYPITDALDIYALLGYAESTTEGVYIAGSTRDISIDGFSWGVGVAYSFTENFAIFADYVDFEDDTVTFTNATNTLSSTFDHAYDAINFGVTYQF